MSTSSPANAILAVIRALAKTVVLVPIKGNLFMVRSLDRKVEHNRHDGVFALSQEFHAHQTSADSCAGTSNVTGKWLTQINHVWKTIAVIVPVMATALAGCTTAEPVAGPLSGEFEGKNATALLQNINSLALQCWIKSGDKAFRGFALVPELDTRSGSPRILIVQKGKSQGLPQLVIEANGNPVKLNTYGPLTSAPLSTRINSDIIAWNTGKDKC